MDLVCCPPPARACWACPSPVSTAHRDDGVEHTGPGLSIPGVLGTTREGEFSCGGPRRSGWLNGYCARNGSRRSTKSRGWPRCPRFGWPSGPLTATRQCPRFSCGRAVGTRVWSGIPWRAPYPDASVGRRLRTPARLVPYWHGSSGTCRVLGVSSRKPCRPPAAGVRISVGRLTRSGRHKIRQNRYLSIRLR